MCWSVVWTITLHVEKTPEGDPGSPKNKDEDCLSLCSLGSVMSWRVKTSGKWSIKIGGVCYYTKVFKRTITSGESGKIQHLEDLDIMQFTKVTHFKLTHDVKSGSGGSVDTTVKPLPDSSNLCSIKLLISLI